MLCLLRSFSRHDELPTVTYDREPVVVSATGLRSYRLPHSMNGFSGCTARLCRLQPPRFEIEAISFPSYRAFSAGLKLLLRVRCFYSHIAPMIRDCSDNSGADLSIDTWTEVLFPLLANRDPSNGSWSCSPVKS
jgi:hypothetical protein